jgi:hypothetical protein
MATSTPQLNPELVGALKRLRLGRIALSLPERARARRQAGDVIR